MSERLVPYTLIAHPNGCVLDRDGNCVRGSEHQAKRHGASGTASDGR